MRTGLPTTTITPEHRHRDNRTAGKMSRDARRRRAMRRMLVGLASAVLLWGGVAGVADLGAAHARPGPAPQSWPGCPPDHPEGPCHWSRRSPGANRQPAGGSGSLGCECVHNDGHRLKGRTAYAVRRDTPAPVRASQRIGPSDLGARGGAPRDHHKWEGDAPPPPPPPNGALWPPRRSRRLRPKLSYRDAPISRSSRLPVYRTDPYSAVPPAVRSSGRHTVAIILSASVCRLAVHSGNR